jgi:hypothetical protein
MTSLSKSRAKEIGELHAGIVQSMRRSVQDAIRIGELLTEVKARPEMSGEFLKWIENELPFAERTARNYMRLWDHRDKTATLADLQDAYRKVEQLEDQARSADRQRLDRLIAEKQATGKKPEGWDRKADYAERKRLDDQGYEERKRKAIEEKQREAERPTEESAQGKSKWDQIYEAIMATPPSKNEDLKLADLRENINQKGMFVVLKEYVDGFDGAHHQLEAVYNLLRFLKRVAIELQPKTQEVKP